jgi:hypothetical protein
MFWQICRDSLHPKQFAALESGVKALLKGAEQMGIDEVEASPCLTLFASEASLSRGKDR